MQTLDYFARICEIPHCSFETEKLMNFLYEFALSKGFFAQKDEFGNIHAVKGKPKICLQAHYDMVCIGDAPKLDVYEENGFLRAKNSSLGADDGIGVAICMEAMSEFENLEILWTNNEEVGLLGANGFDGEIIAENLLNLDSEKEDEIIIGCAAGVGIHAKFTLKREKIKANLYEVSIEGLPGGHSGIEITKNIPNAIKILSEFLLKNDCKLVSFDGGERNNSIPKAAKAIVASQELNSDGIIKVVSLGEKKAKIIKKSGRILRFLCAFSHGLRSYDESLNMPLESVNLAIVSTYSDVLDVEFFARAMSDTGLEKIKFETAALCALAKAKTEFTEQSGAWEPVQTKLAELVLNKMREFIPQAKIATIHAGLECGVLCAKNKRLKACSIGPNIFSPHGTGEKCEIKSVEIIEKVVKNVVVSYQ